MPEAARIIVGEKALPLGCAAFQDQMAVLVSGSGGGEEPRAGHAEMREQVRVVVEDEVEHLAFARGGLNGAAFEGELGVEDVFFKFFRGRAGEHFEGECEGELGADGFDFG